MENRSKDDFSQYDPFKEQFYGLYYGTIAMIPLMMGSFLLVISVSCFEILSVLGAALKTAAAT